MTHTQIRILVLAVGAASLSQFLRSAHGVIGPDLIREIGLDPAQFAAFSGAFFLAAAICQLPAGILFDRIGVRYILPGMLVLTSLGCWAFALAEASWQLIAARILIGVGCSGLIMGSFLLFANWFPPARFALLVSLILGLSQSGNLLATSPLAFASDAFGWRTIFEWVAIFPAILALLYFALIRDRPQSPAPQSMRGDVRGDVRDDVRGGVWTLLINRRLWPVFALASVTYASMVSLLGLWGGTYLYDIYQLSLVDRGHVLLAAICAVALSQFAVGPITRLAGSMRNATSWGLVPGIIGFLFLALLKQPPIWFTIILFLCVSCISATYAPLLAHARAFFPGNLFGRGMALTNCFVMLGTFVIQWGSGLLISTLAPDLDHATIPESAYRIAFFSFALILASAGLWFQSGPDTPKRINSCTSYAQSPKKNRNRNNCNRHGRVLATC